MHLRFKTITGTTIEIDSKTFNISLFFEIKAIQLVLTLKWIRDHTIEIGSRSTMNLSRIEPDPFAFLNIS